MKHLFIVNPTAGSRDCSGEIRALVEEAFRDREDRYEVYVTQGVMDATHKIREEARAGEDLRVYACGGDGTFNECVCGAVHMDNVAVAPFPTGTGNDFCRMFEEEAVLFRDLDALLHGSVTPIDVIECNGRYGANICSAGIDARIGVDVHRYSSIPVIGPKFAYIISTAVNVCKGISNPITIRCDHYRARGKHCLVCVCNGQYYGGGFHPSLVARPDDGMLDVFIIKRMNIFQLIRYIGVYARGGADELPQFVTHLRTQELQLGFGKVSCMQVDGEAVYARRARIRLHPGAMKLIVPQGMRFFARDALVTVGAQEAVTENS